MVLKYAAAYLLRHKTNFNMSLHTYTEFGWIDLYLIILCSVYAY